MKVILRSPALPLLVLGILLKLPVSKVGSRAGRHPRASESMGKGQAPSESGGPRAGLNDSSARH